MGRLFHCGEHLRGSESGNLERFTVSLTSISLFLGVCFVFCVVVCVLFVGFWCCFVFLVLFPPTMLRSSSCPPELTTVRAVMVRAAMEKKKPLQMLCEKKNEKEIIALHKTRPEYFIYMDMRTESDPVTPKVSIPSKRKWEK